MGLFSNAGVGQAKTSYNQALDTSGMLGEYLLAQALGGDLAVAFLDLDADGLTA